MVERPVVTVDATSSAVPWPAAAAFGRPSWAPPIGPIAVAPTGTSPATTVRASPPGCPGPAAGPPARPVPSPECVAAAPPEPTSAATVVGEALPGKPASKPSPRPGPIGPPVERAIPTRAGPLAGASSGASLSGQSRDAARSAGGRQSCGGNFRRHATQSYIADRGFAQRAWANIARVESRANRGLIPIRPRTGHGDRDTETASAGRTAKIGARGTRGRGA